MFLLGLFEHPCKLASLLLIDGEEIADLALQVRDETFLWVKPIAKCG
jgi:hypothetical protein